MTGLTAALDDYLTMRRALGYRLIRPEKLLRQFIDYLDGRGVTTITTDDALAWATLPDHGDASWLAYRLSAVRGFATYLHTIDPETQVPPTDALPWAKRRATPYLYSRDDIAALVSAADGLRSPLRVATYQTLIRLLVITGMRVSEAINLDNADLDLATDVFLVRKGKFGKTRELPLHPSTTAALRNYLRRRDQLRPNRPTTPAVFISPAGKRLLYSNVQATSAQLTRQAGLLPRSATCRPRIHDLRHSFVVQAADDREHREELPPVPLAGPHLSRRTGPRTPRPRPETLVGRRGYAPCRVVVAGGGRVGGVFVRIIPGVGVTAPASRAGSPDRGWTCVYRSFTAAADLGCKAINRIAETRYGGTSHGNGDIHLTEVRAEARSDRRRRAGDLDRQQDDLE